MRNFLLGSFVDDRIAFGAVPNDPLWTKRLLFLGFTHILDVGGDELYECPSGITRLENAVLDDGEAKDVEWFERGIAFVLDALRDPAAKCYVHCHAGVSRSPSMVLAILLSLDYDLNTAESLIRDARPSLLTYKQDAIAAVRALGYGDWRSGYADEPLGFPETLAL